LRADGAMIDFVQWQESASGQLHGTITADQATGSAPHETITAHSTSFTGSISGGSVSLRVSGPLGGQANIVGTLNGNTLTLQAPQNNGTIRQVAITAATVSGFNQAVAALRGRIKHANLLAARTQARRQQQLAAAAAAAKTSATKAAARQAAANRAADGTAQAACKQSGGSWNPAGPADYTADGYAISIPAGPQSADCEQVAYLGSDDATYYLTIYFSGTGAARPAGGGTGTATASECQRGYYPDASTGQPSGKPGTWSNVLGICLPSG
jgi:hypothetical protein